MRRNALVWCAVVLSAGALVSSRLPASGLNAGQDIPEAGQRAAKDLSLAFNAVAEFVRPSVVQINVEKVMGPARLGQNGQGQQGGPEIRQIDPREMEELLKRFFGEQGPGAMRGRDGALEEFNIPRPGRALPNGGRLQRQQLATGTGSGFIYDAKGHILTNNHVVEGADRIRVTFHDGSQAEAKLVGTFPEVDIAVVRVNDASTLHPAQVGTSQNLKVGDWVMAVGSPFGLSQTVTAGIVSATERENLGINRFESFIQTDASINRGNSGGPLVDMNGRVVGVNSAIATASGSNAGVGFAIPIDMAKRVADKLIQKGKLEKAAMGINLDTLRPALARQLGLAATTQGALVVNVLPGTPAERAGLKQGDVITKFDGVPVRSTESLTYMVQTSDPGQAYRVTYLREGKPYDVLVTPEPRERFERAVERRSGQVEQEQPSSTDHATSDFGIAVTPLTPELARRYGYQGPFAFETGLVVTNVAPDSPAAEAGIEPGDLITRFVKEKSIQTADSVEVFNEMLKSENEIAIWVEDVNHRLPGEFKTLAKPHHNGD